MPDILVVDDETVLGNAVKEALMQAGLSAEYVPSAVGLEAQVRARKARIVLMDVMMPGTDGYAACRAIKAAPDLKHVKIIIMTGKSTPKDSLITLEAGADHFMKKPLPLSELLTKIREMLLA